MLALAASSPGGARTCVALAGLFGDTPDPAGVCFPQCAPVSDGLVGRPNDTCNLDETCVLLVGNKEFTCVRVLSEAADLVAFQECQPQPTPGFCFLNSSPQVFAADPMNEQYCPGCVINLGVTGELDYDAGYGPAFYVDPAGVKKAVDSFACQLDDEVKDVIEGAAAAGDYLVGVIS